MAEWQLVGKAMAVWLVMAVVAVANGALREAILIPQFGQGLARPLSAALLASAVLLLTWAFWAWSGRPAAPAVLWLVGLGWLAATMVFEVGVAVREEPMRVGLIRVFQSMLTRGSLTHAGPRGGLHRESHAPPSVRARAALVQAPRSSRVVQSSQVQSPQVQSSQVQSSQASHACSPFEQSERPAAPQPRR